MKTVLFTIAALLCFAANSVLCRLALSDQLIDPTSFTLVRLASGIIMLSVILTIASHKKPLSAARGNWIASVALFVYAITFSFAYISLDTGTGALILFGSVQISMLAWQRINGKRLNLFEWCGALMAFAGLIYLVYPTIATPSAMGLLLMTTAGCAWAVYTIRGKASLSPLADTTLNFVRTVPWLCLLALLMHDKLQMSTDGFIYACLSGALASGIGYTLWYVALEKLSATLAAVTQLLVPAIAAMGGVLFVGEMVSLRLTFAAAIILGGIGLIIYAADD
ncbi:MAG: DMT family transporter [Gammaproteobacteria bacterium]